MKRAFAAALVAVPLLALPARAHIFQVLNSGCCGGCGPVNINAGLDFHCKVCAPGNFYGAPLGPWYNYWPLEAHFQTPAMPCYPYWPSPMALPGAAAAAGYCPYPAYPQVPVPGVAPASGTLPAARPLEPVGYQTGAQPSYQVPGLWLGR
jgi:hypothetical protein